MSAFKTVIETLTNGKTSTRIARDAGHASRMTERIQRQRPASKVTVKDTK